MNYTIISDENKLQEFIDFLPDLEESEVYYISVFARSKYSSDRSVKVGDKAAIKRVVCNKKNMINKLRQLETVVGSYVYDGQSIPQEMLAVYIHINPRCKKLVGKNVLKRFADLVTGDRDYSPHSEVLNCYQDTSSCRRRLFTDFDFDNKKIEDISFQILSKDLINLSAIRFIKTRGGFHLLVKHSEIEEKYVKKWHNNISSLGIDKSKGNMTPLVGAYQGGFIPEMMTNINYII